MMIRKALLALTLAAWRSLVVAIIAACTIAACSNASSDAGDGDNAPSGAPLETSIIAASPVKITKCKAVLTTTTDTKGNSVPHLWVYSKLMNSSSKSVKAVTIQYSTYTAFGELQKSDGTNFAYFDLTLTGTMSPGEDDASSQNTFDHPFPDVGKIHCTMARVKYSDGTEWSPDVTSSTDEPVPPITQTDTSGPPSETPTDAPTPTSAPTASATTQEQ